ncbi:MAG: NAD(P)H-hydrate dehydratase [Gammaproteobacteria bacterium]|nr:NAD(P)H-hydrate dehydratase [Gammaproteobacteria bacterium]
MSLPASLYTAAQVRELDRLAIAERGMSGAKLMQAAAAAAFKLLRTRWPRARRIAVICGPGNNGGDGYMLASLAQVAGLTPTALSLGDTDKKSTDALAARKHCKAAGVSMKNFSAELLAGNDLIVDALSGIGLEREVSDEWRAAIEAVNQSGIPVLAIDIPSGLHADAGRVMGVAVKAAATLTYIGLKAGLFTGAGREHGGEIFFDDLGVSASIYTQLSAQAQRLTPDTLYSALPRRRRDLHKGDAGHVLIIGGDQGMPGAVCLAGEAAYRAGAGLVVLATHPNHAAQIGAAHPELIVHGVASPEALRLLLARTDVIAIGPGLGQGEWGHALFGAVLDTSIPMIVDADALNFLAADPLMHRDWILTPHPGEAARLLGMRTEEIQADRFVAVRELVASFGGVAVLKGSGTLIASLKLNMERRASAASRAILDDAVALCDRGNPGMASGGMGDVLTGVIAGLRAQGLPSTDAACLGVWLHAAAGDDAAASGEIGLLASDLFPFIRARLNRLVADAPS